MRGKAISKVEKEEHERRDTLGQSAPDSYSTKEEINSDCRGRRVGTKDQKRNNEQQKHLLKTKKIYLWKAEQC